MCFNRFFAFGVFTLAILGGSCNPDCQSIVGLRAVTPRDIIPGNQLLLAASPNEQLRGRRITINGIPAESEYAEGNGLVVTVPEELSNGPVEVRVEDTDCEDFLALNFNVVDQTFFENSTQYVVPSPPEVIIPTLPSVFPSDITNAWISPQNADYCLWLGSLTEQIRVNAEGDTVLRIPTNILDNTTLELSTCGDDSRFYHANPVSGTVDCTNNSIELTIDRTARGLGIEKYVGEFINIESSGYSTIVSQNECTDGVKGEKEHMILLTSLKTGQQLIVSKAAAEEEEILECR